MQGDAIDTNDIGKATGQRKLVTNVVWVLYSSLICTHKFVLVLSTLGVFDCLKHTRSEIHIIEK